jgi:hypothetical protein
VGPKLSNKEFLSRQGSNFPAENMHYQVAYRSGDRPHIADLCVRRVQWYDTSPFVQGVGETTKGSSVDLNGVFRDR